MSDSTATESAIACAPVAAKPVKPKKVLTAAQLESLRQGRIRLAEKRKAAAGATVAPAESVVAEPVVAEPAVAEPAIAEPIVVAEEPRTAITQAVLDVHRQLADQLQANPRSITEADFRSITESIVELTALLCEKSVEVTLGNQCVQKLSEAQVPVAVEEDESEDDIESEVETDHWCNRVNDQSVHTCTLM